MDFTGKNVLITGASKGIGRATARAFAQRGARVGVHYRSDEEGAQETLRQMEGDPHTPFQSDISEVSEGQQLVRAFVEQYGSLDILVNNAGHREIHPVDDSDFDQWQQAWDRILDTNLRGTAHLCYGAAQQMMEQEGGRIVNVSSRGAFRGEPQMPAYGASKAGLNALSQSLAKALAPYDIYVGVVAPGFTETDSVVEGRTDRQLQQIREESPMGRMARPEEVAYAIAFLASEGAEYTTGTILDVNGASYFR